MTDITAKPTWNAKPPQWVNTMMTRLSRAPVLHNLVSSGILLLSFTGRKSGKHYETPVSYMQGQDGTVMLMTKAFRTWWHNFEEPAPVTVWLRGERRTGTAAAQLIDAESLPCAAEFLAARPRDAQFYGVTLIDGKPDPDDIYQLAGKLVLVTITLD